MADGRHDHRDQGTIETIRWCDHNDEIHVERVVWLAEVKRHIREGVWLNPEQATEMVEILTAWLSRHEDEPTECCSECLEDGDPTRMVHDEVAGRWAHRGCVDGGDR